MDGLTLDTLMRRDKHVSPLFVGVFAADTLPRRLNNYPALLICNTDPISKPGQHWIAFFIDKNGVGEYWDSYGFPPLVAHHKRFLNRLCKKWTYNHSSLQAIDSMVCGEYCVLYLVHRAHGYSLHSFVHKLFTSDPIKNDTIVRKLFKRMFGKKRVCVIPAATPTQRCCKRRK